MPKKQETEEKISVEPVSEEESLHLEKDVVVVAKSEEDEALAQMKERTGVDVAAWKPKTTLGTFVKEGKITNIDAVLERGDRILEPEIVDILLPNMESELLMVGQSKGKFGGGARRIFRQTQKKTPEGNKPSFATVAVVGNKNGYVGVGFGKSKDTVPAREKAIRNAKLNIFKVFNGCGSWECQCGGDHSLPFRIEGKCGSVRIALLPAPKGKGLIVDKEIAKILLLAGFKDVWSKSKGQTRITINTVAAAIDALRKLGGTKTGARIFAAHATLPEVALT